MLMLKLRTRLLKPNEKTPYVVRSIFGSSKMPNFKIALRKLLWNHEINALCLKIVQKEVNISQSFVIVWFKMGNFFNFSREVFGPVLQWAELRTCWQEYFSEEQSSTYVKVAFARVQRRARVRKFVKNILYTIVIVPGTGWQVTARIVYFVL